MKNKLHKSNTTCHAELVSASHNTSIHVTSSLSRSHKINKLLFLLLFPLWGLGGYAQNYQWDWAMSGGGIQGVDQIYDVKIGTDNNYYFIASMHGTIGIQLDGATVTTHNSSLGGKDIFIFSTTCDGQVRWSQSIGGQGNSDRAFNLALDGANNVYVGVHVQGGNNYSVGFDSDPQHSIAPLPNPEAYKRIFLVKYNSNGQYQGRKALQGNVDNTNNSAQLLDLFIENNTIHFITGLSKGTHLDNHVTVPNTITAYQYFLVKYDTDLDYVSSLLLPIPDGTGFSNNPVNFVFNDSSNKYYISSIRDDGSSLIPMTYDGKTIVNRSYLIAFNGTNGSLDWHREIYSQPLNGQGVQTNRIFTLKIDANSDIYIGGCLYKSQNETNLKIYDPTDPTNPSKTYLFTPGAPYGTMPMIAKLNSSGTVQWVQTTAAYNANALVPGARYGSGIALRGNEVAFGVQGANEFWDNIEIQNPVSHQPDPILIRFNKQTGNVIAIHEIPGSPSESQQSIALAVDNDGNYISTGIFTGGLFINTGSNVQPVLSVGETDFYVAKLAASVCGTTVSTEDFSKLNLKVYPNPTTDIVNIETQETLQSYEVYNVLGQQIQKGTFNGNNQINLHGATTGTYFIKVSTQQGSNATVKVVKK